MSGKHRHLVRAPEVQSLVESLLPKLAALEPTTATVALRHLRHEIDVASEVEKKRLEVVEALELAEKSVRRLGLMIGGVVGVLGLSLSYLLVMEGAVEWGAGVALCDLLTLVGYFVYWPRYQARVLDQSEASSMLASVRKDLERRGLGDGS